MIKSMCLRGILIAGLICGLPSQATLAAPSATPGKVLRYVFPAAESGFDPVAVHDYYSSHVTQSIFETLYTFDYLARPVTLVPLTADALPEITNGGRTYTIRLKKGIYFADDAAFNGKKRELTMEDYAYSFKRLFDPKLRSPNQWLLEGKVVGLDELSKQAKSSGRFDYNAKVAGLELVDRYTLRINLNQPDFNLGQILAHQPTSALAREVVEKYQDAQGLVQGNPVGTGPYRLTQWVRGSRIVLDANPAYRSLKWDFKAGSDPEDQRIVAQMKGKRIPSIDRVDISVMVEDQSRWLAFNNDEIDLFQLYGPLAPRALAGGKLKPELAQRGIQLSRIVDPEITYYYWNMEDPVWGGFTKDKIALRRAVAMAYDVAEEIRIVWNGESMALEYPIPPGVVGHDPDYKSIIQFDLPAANALLDKFGYKKGADGWRTLPNGAPLRIRYSARADSLGQRQSEMWKKSFNSIGIRMTEDMRPFSELLKAEKQCQLQMRTASWIADYPDGDNFMQLFYGPNVGQTNNGCTRIPEYDALYVQTQKLPAGPERDAMYHKMARILEVNAVQRLGHARYSNMLAQGRVKGYKRHPFLPAVWMYMDIEESK